MEWSPITTGDGRTRTFPGEEMQRLQILRRRYELQPDIFSDTELGKLEFVRWLVSTDRLQVRTPHTV